MKIDSRTSKTFMIANLLCTLLVVIIHYNSLQYINVHSGYNINYYFQQFVTNGLGRSAVPLFALLSGFFISNHITNLASYSLMLKKRFWTILIPYSFASAVIFFSYLLLSSLTKSLDSPEISPQSIIEAILIQPISVQFWYLRDLIVLVIISPLLIYRTTHIRIAFTSILAGLWLLNIQPMPLLADWHIINIETTFFFSLGGLMSLLDRNRIKRLVSGPALILIAIWSSLIITRIYLKPDLDTWYQDIDPSLSLITYKISILFGVISIFAIASRLVDYRPLLYLSSLTFFVYLFHLTPLEYFKFITYKIIPSELAFYVNAPVALLTSFLLAHLCSQWFPKLYSIITGNRQPKH